MSAARSSPGTISGSAGSGTARMVGKLDGRAERQLALDLVANALERESPFEVESLQVVRRIEVEPEQRIVDHLDAGVGEGSSAEMRRERVQAEEWLDHGRRREEQRVRAGARVGRSDDDDRSAVARRERGIGSVQESVERIRSEQRQ